MPPREKATPDVPPDLTDQNPANMTDEELAKATARASRDAGNTVRLRLHRAFPVDHFEHTIDGKTYSIPATDPDSGDGTDVPAEVEDAITAAAKEAGLTVKKVSE